jgi:hypothetical protein
MVARNRSAAGRRAAALEPLADEELRAASGAVAVHVGQVHSTVRQAGDDGLLGGGVLGRLVAHVVDALRG